MSDTITASFGLDIGPLKSGFAQAEATAKNGSAKVAAVMRESAQKASQAFSQVAGTRLSGLTGGGIGNFVSPRDARRMRNSAAGFAPAPAGKYPKPGEEEEERAGAASGRGGYTRGLGRAITIFAGLREASSLYEKAMVQAKELREANDNIFRPIGGGTAAPIEEFETKLKDIHEVNEKIRNRSNIENSGWLGSLLKLGRKATGKSLGEGSFSDQDKQDVENRKNRDAAALSAVNQMAAKQRELNKIDREGFKGSEEQAELDKAELNNRERLLKISTQEAAAGFSGHSKNADAENERFAQEKTAIRQRFDIRGKELEIEDRIVSLKQSGLTKDRQEVEELQNRIGLLRQEQKMSITDENRSKKEVQIRSLGNDLLDAQQRSADQSPEGVRARNAENIQTLKDKAFRTNMGQAQDEGRGAYHSTVSGLGPVGPQKAPEYFTSDVFSGGGHMPEPTHMADHPVIQAITHLADRFDDKMDEHWSQDDEDANGR